MDLCLIWAQDRAGAVGSPQAVPWHPEDMHPFRETTIGSPAIMMAGSGKPAKAFIIGGPDLHARALPVAQRVYVTEVDVEMEGADEFAPPVPPTLWMRHLETGWRAFASGMRYRFVEYRRAGR